MFPQVDLHIYERSMFSHRFYVTDCDGAPADLTGYEARLEIRRDFEPNLELTSQLVSAADDGNGNLLLTYADALNPTTPVVFSSTDTLPGGLTAGTTYYLVPTSETTAAIADSFYTAKNYTVLSYMDGGVGDHTMVATMFVSTVEDDLTVNEAGGYVDLTWSGVQTEIIGNTHGPVLRYDLFVFPTSDVTQAIIIAHGYVVAKKNVTVPYVITPPPT